MAFKQLNCNIPWSLSLIFTFNIESETILKIITNLTNQYLLRFIWICSASAGVFNQKYTFEMTDRELKRARV